MNLSVIIPIYNEMNTLEEILSRVQATGLPNEIILVDDGSIDGTREIVQKYQGKEGFIVLFHERNQGKRKVCLKLN